jgi:hypothetical protein
MIRRDTLLYPTQIRTKYNVRTDELEKLHAENVLRYFSPIPSVKCYLASEVDAVDKVLRSLSQKEDALNA